MNIQNILNADMETLGGWLKTGFGWWVEELRAMLPATWRDSFSSRTALTAEPQGGQHYRFYRSGNEIAFSPKTNGRLTPVTLILPSSQVLLRTMDMPLLSAKDIDRLVVLDIDRLTPFSADNIYYDVRQLARDSESGRQKIILGVVTKNVARTAVDNARDYGLDVKCLVAADTRLDFMPKIRASEGKDDETTSRLFWWGAVAALLFINLAVLILRDVHDVNQLQSTIDGQSATANVGRQLRQHIEKDQALRDSVIARRASQEPLKILSAISQSLPDDAWVQRMTWNGQTVRLAGYKRGALDIMAALLHSAFLRNVRPSTNDNVAKSSSGQPFDVTADIKTIQPNARAAK